MLSSCLVLFHQCWVCAAGGTLLLELNRVLRPGGFFVWSATPVYWDGAEDVQIWNGMTASSLSLNY